MDSKRKTPTIRSSNKHPRVLAVDTSWCLRNKENLDVTSFAKEFGYTDQAKCHARYKAILNNHIPSENKLRLQHIRTTNASNIGTSYTNTIRNTNTDIIRTNFSYQ
ncbi:hypothetical protein RO3G_00909 [Rhizopus delemar RA 99-880]|uniref:Uncharacterized protein n=1 Tax=Rhizopus delemar (strain RA 99-880 / ATCC MYA-4621 / FGSC 9543 / NRRL 43880) TaxID=246409 RepID=I1BJ25_RHIO9|nr:hypothetical protein RO3G_00909 [Rhizopus delemar RA 99-880]|eukprot:EIE76205.1 hypothetical protein RO3G_00909 [Rhizopus delemar RA 99-880]